jgi:hypothetical protein
MTQSTLERSQITDLTDQSNPTNAEQIKNILEVNPFTSSQSSFLFAEKQFNRIHELRNLLDKEIKKETAKQIFIQISVLINKCKRELIGNFKVTKQLI